MENVTIAKRLTYDDEGPIARRATYTTGSSWTQEEDNALVLFSLSRCGSDGKWNKTLSGSLLWEDASHFVYQFCGGRKTSMCTVAFSGNLSLLSV